MRSGLILAVAAVVATPAMAKDRVGYTQIAAGDLAGAERTLVAERRIFPARPELMLNLAAVYARTGRTAEAAALYRSALVAPAVTMDMPDGTSRSSHDIAETGRAQLASVTVEVAGR